MATKAQNFRKAVRQNLKKVIGYIDRNYVLRENGKVVTPSKELICMFCGSDQSITKEHIIPRWVFAPNKDYSPFQVLSAIRLSLKRLSVDKKYKHLNSLVVFKTSNQSFHFFHTIDDFIFMELPQYQIALFYFFNEEFETVKAAHDKAMSIIKKVY